MPRPTLLQLFLIIGGHSFPVASLHSPTTADILLSMENGGQSPSTVAILPSMAANLPTTAAPTVHQRSCHQSSPRGRPSQQAPCSRSIRLVAFTVSHASASCGVGDLLCPVNIRASLCHSAASFLPNTTPAQNHSQSTMSNSSLHASFAILAVDIIPTFTHQWQQPPTL